MDSSFVRKLEDRARTMLPPATVMLVECRSDESGDPALTRLLEEIQQKGLRGEELCSEPYETVVFEDRVLLRCRGCPRMDSLPRVAGIGRGGTEEEAHRNALYALTIPLDRPTAKKDGCLAAQTWGSGPVEETLYACIFNRAAYA